MFKTLLNKQLLELKASFLQDRKTGKLRTGKALVGYILLLIFVFLVLGVSFFSIGVMMGPSLYEVGQPWFYFVVTGVLSILLGTFGSAFNTYAGLYNSKDNEMLLSMPIPPGKILLSRIAGVYGMGIFYEAMVYVPMCLAYWIFCEITILGVIYQIILFFAIGFFILGLTCLLGWIIAVIAGKLKNKSVISLLLAVVFLVGYMYVCGNAGILLDAFGENAASFALSAKESFYPAYIFGSAFVGSTVDMLIVLLFNFAVLFLVYLIMSRSFIKMITTNHGTKKKEYKQVEAKSLNVSTALLQKEFKRFTSSTTYMLNCGLGVVFAIAILIVAIVKSSDLPVVIDVLSQLGIDNYIPLILVVAPLLCVSMNCITAPSVSMEGRNIWIVQTMPIKASDVLHAKIKLHTIFNTVPAVITVIGLMLLFKLDFVTIVFGVTLVYMVVLLEGTVGLILNLKMPNIHWVNETVPVKQGMPVMIALFGGWALLVVLLVLYYLVSSFISSGAFLIVMTAIFAVIIRLLNRWIDTKGSEIFSYLS